MFRLASPSSSPATNLVARMRRSAIAAALLALAVAVPAHAAITANKTFTPDAVAAGQPSKVTFYFLNANIADATSLAFVDSLPTGMQVAPTPNAVTNCGGTLTAVAGATSVSFSGGTLPKAIGTTPGQCDLSFDVIVLQPNVLINTVPAGEVTSSEGPNSQDAQATLNVTGLAPIIGTKTFGPLSFVHGYLPLYSQPIPVGGKSTVTITLNNPNGIALTNVTFTDNLPATPAVASGGIVVSPVPNASTTCGGTFVPVAGAKSVTLSGGTIPAGGSCNVRFDVVAESPTSSAQSNITNLIPAGAVTSFEGPTNSSFSAAITRQTGGALVKSFSPGTIDNNGTSLMTITVRNYNASAQSGIGFTDNLPAGMTIADPAQPAFASGDCQFATSTVASGFSVAAAPGGTSIVVSGGALVGAPNTVNPAQCTIRVNVTGTNAGQSNLALVNTIFAGTWDGGVKHSQASATLTIRPTSPITGTKSFSPTPVFQGSTSVATIVLTNASGVAMTNVAFTDNVQSKMGGGITVLAAPAPASNCGMSSAINPAGTVISFSGGSIAAGGTCTITFTVQTLNTTSPGNHVNTIDVGAVTASIPGATVNNRIALAGTLVVTAVAQGSKAFSPGTVPAGTDSLLTITITQPNGAPVWSSFTITDPLPAGHTVSPVAATPAANACVGTLTAPAGSTSIQFTGNPPASGTSCTIRVNVRTPAGTAGTATNTIPPGSFVVTTAGQGSYSNGSNISANIRRVTGSVTLTKSFDPAVVDLLGTSTMFLRIVNTAGNALNLTGVNLEDNLPAGLRIAAVPNAQFTGGAGCTLGTLTAVPLDTKVTLANASVAAGKVCTIEVLTQAVAAGNLINQVPAGALATTQGITNLEPVAATVTSTGLSHLTISKDDGVTQLKAGGTTTYTVIVSNGNGANVADVAGATFTDTPPAGMTFTAWSCVASPNAVCTANGTGPIVDTVTIPKGGSITYTIDALLAADYVAASVQNCATIAPPGSVIDDDPQDNQACDTDSILRGLTLKKVWVNAIGGDAIAVTTTGLASNATVSSTSTGNNTTTGTQVFNLAGAAVQLPAEGFTAGSQANYTTTLSCTGAAASSSTPPASFTMPDADVVCTYTNTRISRGLILKKAWVNGTSGDKITVATSGLVNNASVASTSTGNNTDTGLGVTNVPGGTVTLPAETFDVGSQAHYTTTVSCTGATPSASTPPATFTMPDADVVCTYTNTAVQAGRRLTLQKSWVNGKSGDRITVSTTGLTTNASVTSTSSGGNTDAGTAVDATPGATVTLPAETFDTGSPSNYTTTVSCAGATPSGSSPGATYTMPDNDVTCTYTNTRKSATLQLVKTWITAAVNDTVTLSAAGITNSAGAQLVAVANTANETDPGSAVTVYAGEVAALSEGSITPSGRQYLKSLSCSGNANPIVGANLTVSASDTAIVCTFTNQGLTPAPPPPIRPVPVNSPLGLAALAAMLALAGALATRRRGWAQAKGFRSRWR